MKAIVVVAALTCLVASASAAPFLMIDFNGRDNFGSGNVGPTEAGFTAFDIPVNNDTAGLTTFSRTFGDYSVRLNVPSGGLLQGRARTAPSDNGSLTYGELYRDFTFNNPGGSTQIQLELSGLGANTEYDVRLFSFDGSGTETTLSTVTWSVVTGTGSSGSITFRRHVDALPTEDLQYSTLIRATTDASGMVRFTGARTSGTGNVVVLNGFTVSAVPEPTGAAFIGAVSLVALRRWRAC